MIDASSSLFEMEIIKIKIKKNKTAIELELGWLYVGTHL
jgi:hypothetical protein